MTLSKQLIKVWLSAWVVAVTVLCALSSARAEFVTDRFMVGIHSDSAPESAILKLIPSGSELLVVERASGFAKIRDGQGGEGWVDAAYLVDTLPGAMRQVELEAQLLAVSEQLQSVRAAEQDLRGKAAEMETQLIRQREAFAKREAELARDSLQELEELRTKFSEIEQSIPQSAGTEAPVQAEELQRLQEENRYLGQQLAQARKPTPIPLPAPPRVVHVSQPFAVADVNAWHWTFVVSVLLLAFAIGAYAIDWDVRRRHGGFRV